MKAVTRSKYGSPEVLSLEEVATPIPGVGEILVKVYAATVNRTDCAILTAKPFLMRFFTGFFVPKLKIMGTDFAGQIVGIGNNVSGFAVGDRVFGFNGLGYSSHAEYISIPENGPVIRIPDTITYEQAAASAEAAYYAIDMVDMVEPKAAQKALVNGATGAIGSATVQFLKYYGLYVTAVCHSDHTALVQSLGADKIIPYNKVDFTKDEEQYDLVFDAVGKSSFGNCKPLLKPKGIFASTEPNILQVIISSLLGGKKYRFRPPKDTKAALTKIKGLLETGRFCPVIDRCYALAEIVTAFEYVASGQKIGNVILNLELKTHL